MIEGFVNDALATAKAWLAAQFAAVLAPFLDPLYHWYAMGAAAFVAAFVVGYFFPFKWVRAALGFFLLLVGAYIAGGRQMHNDMQAQIKRRRK